MTLTLTSERQSLLADASERLAFPLDGDARSDWFADAALAVQRAIGGSASFAVVPVGKRLRVSTHTYGGVVSDRYVPEFMGTLDRIGLAARVAEQGVCTRRQAYGPHYEAMQASDYGAYVRSVGGYDSVNLALPWHGAARPVRSASDALQITVNTNNSARAFDADEVAMAGLLLPMLRAGVASYLRLHAVRGELGRLLDAVGTSLVAFDRTGGVVHQTPAAGEILSAEPLRDTVSAAAHRLAMRAGSGALGAVEAVVAGARGRYRLSAVRSRLLASSPSVLVTIDPLFAAARPSPRRVADALGLTPRQGEVAVLLAERRTNREIADALGVSVSTARHHVEHVLGRLGAARRDVQRLVAESSGFA